MGILGALLTAAPAAAQASAGFSAGKNQQTLQNTQTAMQMLQAKRENDLANSKMTLEGLQGQDFQGAAAWRNEQALQAKQRQDQEVAERATLADHLPAILNPDTPEDERQQHIAAVTAAMGDRAAPMLKDLVPKPTISYDGAGNPYTVKNGHMAPMTIDAPGSPAAPSPATPQQGSPTPSASPSALQPAGGATSTSAPPLLASKSGPSALPSGTGKFGPAATREAELAWQQAHPTPITPYQQKELALHQQQVDNSTLKEFVDAQGVKHFDTSVNAKVNGWLPVSKTAGTGAPNALAMGALSRVQQVSDALDQYDPVMRKMEDPKSPQNITQVGPLQTGASAAALTRPSVEAHGAGGLLGNIVAGAGSWAGQKVLSGDPLGQAYQNYQRGGTAIGVGMAEMNPRPNNALIGVEKDLAMANYGDYNKQLTDLTQLRRQNASRAARVILKMNPAYVQAMMEQDPDWVYNQLGGAIRHGTMPTAPAGPPAAAPAAPGHDPILAKYQGITPVRSP